MKQVRGITEKMLLVVTFLSTMLSVEHLQLPFPTLNGRHLTVVAV
jgi:hypothetical protein